MFYVLVIEDETQEVVKAIECESESKAEKVEDGLLRQMNYEKFSSKIVTAEEYLHTELARVKAERDEAVGLLAKAGIPYEAIRMDAPSRKWIAPEIWNEIESVSNSIRAFLAKVKP